jgi:UDP-N-acetylglucosamine--N-acetylmuramyl-(pentapeptide) pyrophosphoryl-undecaprenol N-acetylglucosamine transferase
MSESPHIVIAGGGTGGHLFPGLAVADELRDRGARVTFVGTARGIEARAVPRAGYALELIDVGGLKRMGTMGTIRNVLRLPGAAANTLRLLRRLRPQVVVGVGGYASGPVVMLAALLRLPTAVLEQNSVPGVTNRLLGRVVRRVFTAFPTAASFFPGDKVRLLGNPIRRTLLVHQTPAQPVDPADGAARARVLVLGGSQGAHAVNDLLLKGLEGLPPPERAGLPLFHHQTGAADAEPIMKRYRALGLSEAAARVEPFIEDMAAAYAGCDLVVGRAGATTLAEVTAIGRPAVLVPLPTAADDHQTKNAEWLMQEGAALVLSQRNTSPAALVGAVLDLCRDRAKLSSMASASRRLGRPDAARVVADALLDLRNP